MRRHFKENDIDMLSRKQVYLYDYMSSWDKFEDKKLPSKGDFNNILTKSSISDEDYAHAQNVWNHFGLSNLGDYHNLYLTTDVLLLADVFETFRTTALKIMGLTLLIILHYHHTAWMLCSR